MKKNIFLVLLITTLAGAESNFKLSMGGGVLFVSDFGGGIVWSPSEQQVRMPNDDWGTHLFIDAVYAEFTASYSGTFRSGTVDSSGRYIGSSRWRSANATNNDNLPTMPRTNLTAGAFVKLPFMSSDPSGAYVRMYPIVGGEYALSVSGKLKYKDGSKYEFNGKDGHPAANALSARWLKFGLGFDMGGDGGYMRGEFLYGFRTANAFE